MIHSMTGVGSGRAEGASDRVEVEMRSLNHRGMEISLKTSPALTRWEGEVRSRISKRFSRGKFHIFIRHLRIGEGAVEMRVSIPLLKGCVNAAKAAERELGREISPSFGDLLQVQGLLEVREEPADAAETEKALFEALERACDALEARRAREGEELSSAIEGHISAMDEAIGRISGVASKIVESYRARLRSRLRELLESSEMDERRFEMEIAIMADRSDIREELDRLASHIGRMRDILAEGGPSGIEMNFLSQEILRELNTIGSKSNDLGIAKAVIDGKTAIERIREQVGNLE